MEVVKTELLSSNPPGVRGGQIYNGLDCCITAEVLPQLLSQLDQQTKSVYDFERAMQAPALDMMRRGILIDMEERDIQLHAFEIEIAYLEKVLNRFAYSIWDRPLNANSPQQVGALFYDFMGLKEQTFKGRRTVNRDALEKLLPYYYARPLISTILALRDRIKLASVLRTGIDKDRRLRCSYNVAGTETGRWSSSKNVRGGGMNLQNVTESLRGIFIADPGKKQAYVDLEQAESRLTGLQAWMVTGKSTYLDACESGDLHTQVCKLVWPELLWTGDPRADREIADRKFYRHWTYRDLSKRGGHGTNYYGRPPTMARHLHVRTVLMEEFQERYFYAFPEIPEYHLWVAEELQTKRFLVTPLGRKRYFFGRPDDDATLREAIAFIPQSSVGDLLNRGLYNVWRLSFTLPIELLLQVHDAGYFQYPTEMEDELLPKIIKAIEVPLEINERHFMIPAEGLSGWNWAKYNDDPEMGPINLDGIKKWKGQHDNRERTKWPATSMLARRIS